MSLQTFTVTFTVYGTSTKQIRESSNPRNLVMAKEFTW